MSQSKQAKPLDVIVDAFPASVKHSDIAEVVTGRRNGNCSRALLGLSDDGLVRQLGDKSWVATDAGRALVLGEKVVTTKARPRAKAKTKAKTKAKKPAGRPFVIDVEAGVREASKRKAAREAKAATTPKAGKGSPSTVFGFPVCQVIRSLAHVTKMTPREIQAAIAAHVDAPPAIATCRTQVGHARRKGMTGAPLIAEQLAQLTGE